MKNHGGSLKNPFSMFKRGLGEKEGSDTPMQNDVVLVPLLLTYSTPYSNVSVVDFGLVSKRLLGFLINVSVFSNHTKNMKNYHNKNNYPKILL